VNGTRWLAVSASSLAVALGGGAALAETGSSNPASDFLGDVAKRLGISEDKLEDAIQEATIERIDAAVAAGDITKAEGDALKERVRSGDVPPPVVPGFGGPSIEHAPFGLKGVVGPDVLDAAAGYLGMDESDVREALRDGKSLADLADEKGKSVDGLVQALRDEIRNDADEAVEDGALTDEQAERLVERLSDGVDELVQEPGGPALGPRPPGPLPGFLPGSDLVETAADYLGIEDADVREAIRDGDSLAELARDHGKSVDGLKQTLRGTIRADVDQAVEDGVLTEEQAGRLAEKLGNAVDKLVEGGFGFEFRFHVAPDDRMPVPVKPS
jgi:lambda repressor-like predicted transcriptional regulator/uncharacterized protein YidB (DUF937 family)